MDFFKYASIVGELSPTKLWVKLLMGGLCFAIVFIFEAIALFTIATKNGYKNKWMAFIPFFNTYYIGVCAQKNKFYNVNAKTIGLVAAIFEVILVALSIFSLTASEILLKADCLEKIENVVMGWNVETYQLKDDVPSNLQWAAWVYTNMDTYILSILDMVFLILEIVLLICFFQTYACRRYVIFSITSVLFPIMGILFFIVRNNKGVNYKDFIRAEQARQYQIYQQYQQQNYNNPYNQNYNQNPYNHNPYNSSNNGDGGADPFDEFNSSSNTNGNSTPKDPFDDFDK